MGTTNPKIKKMLLKKLGITAQALSQQAQRLKQKRSMTTEIAIYLIAHRNGIKIDKYLNDDIVEKVGQIQDKLAKTSSVTPVRNTKKTTIAKAINLKIDEKILSKAPFISSTELQSSVRMAQVFPYLYILENSIRNFIIKALSKYYGTDFWEQATNRKLRETIKYRKKNEEKNLWHQRRSVREIDYLDLDELIVLIDKVDSKLVSDNILPREGWLQSIIHDVYESRCVLCHMNLLLSDSVKLIQANYNKWCNQVNGKLELL